MITMLRVLSHLLLKVKKVKASSCLEMEGSSVYSMVIIPDRTCCCETAGKKQK